MLKAKDFRERAWAHLGNNWFGEPWTVYLLAVLVEMLMVGASASTGIIIFIIGGPLALGSVIVSTKVVRGEQVKFEDYFKGFDNFGSALILYILNNLLIFLWSLLFIVPGIIKSYSYAMSFYILRDNPTMSANDARKRSMEMMKGNKWRLFCLHFSFIGWNLLSVLTFGILSLWVEPYYRTAQAEFYQSLLDGEKEREPEVLDPAGEQKEIFGDISAKPAEKKEEVKAEKQPEKVDDLSHSDG